MEAQRRYVSFVFDGLGEGHRKDFHEGASDKRVLGDDRFLEQISGFSVDALIARPSLDDIITVVCQNYRLDYADLKTTSQKRQLAEARAMVAWLAKTFKGATLTEVGLYFHRDVGTMSSTLRRLVQRSAAVSEFKERMAKLEERLKET